MMAFRVFFTFALAASLFATGCKKEDGGTGTGGGTSITVNGFVKDAGGEPIAGAAVLVPGKSAVTSGSDGSFSISNVTIPYDITFVVSGTRRSFTYKGLTRPDPTVHAFIQFFSFPKTATITGTVPNVTGVTRVMFVSGDVSKYTSANQGSYTLSLTWRGAAATLNGTIHVLRWTSGPDGMPASYNAYGNRALTVSDGGTFPGNDFSAGQLTNPAEDNISGAVTRASTSYTLNSRELYIGFENSIIYLSGESGALGDNLSYTVPNIAGATFGIFASAYFGSRNTFYIHTGIAGGSQGVTIPLADAPQLTAPSSGGSGIDTTTQFLFSQGGGTGVNAITVGAGNSTDPSFYVVTTSNTFMIPNLSQLGLGLPSNKSYFWYTVRFFPFSSADEAASPLLISRLARTAGDVGQSQSETFSFTTR